MARFVLRNEILFRSPTRIGLLADVTEKLFANGVNVLGIRAYDERDAGVFLIFADDSRLAAEALSPLEGTIKTVQVISAVVPNTPGQLAEISRALANADLNVSQVHSTTTDAPMAEIVLDTSDNVAALAVLQNL